MSVHEVEYYCCERKVNPVKKSGRIIEFGKGKEFIFYLAVNGEIFYGVNPARMHED